ncbi:MAG: zinc ribbon domain-containing protein [Candidatus Latescibacteria bacterium]|nr:zinc ribbon domain-containing protein [Candidatus Latescibacterota bacterium]NIM66482.1 zinc ribbon domain-containing protein [Candidatus Latescibacterota bacterium]NIO02962.1 zinc ribbon domain-containing protein [Candidatus Latescibacterota bacterium]NIO30097.1 zinc ribbon domain-containing protein [Candidatus Latescibacterota bacterium]NIO57716.1 zinc ribbon domain-containing protein [Candidatus Latescibacterota bacterium]
MPTYAYECTKCRRKFEIDQKISDPPRKRCPHCRGKVFRVISGGGGVILRGNGFYATDYRSEDYKKKAAADNGSISPASEKEKKNKAA